MIIEKYNPGKRLLEFHEYGNNNFHSCVSVITKFHRMGHTVVKCRGAFSSRLDRMNGNRSIAFCWVLALPTDQPAHPQTGPTPLSLLLAKVLKLIFILQGLYFPILFRSIQSI